MSGAQSVIVPFRREPDPGTITIGGKSPDLSEVQINILSADQFDDVAAPEVVGPDDAFNRNLAVGFDDHGLDAIAGFLLEAIETDIQSRAGWEETAEKGAKYLGIKLEDPSSSVSADGTITKAVSSAMLEALIKLWSTARAELLPVGGPVKTRRDSSGPVSQAKAANDKDKLADDLATDMNYFLTQTDKEYYPDFSKMLSNRALIGMAFRKAYRCPLKRRPRSVWVKAVNLIVSNDTSHLSGAGRITERIRYSQGTMRRLQVLGHYRDVVLVRPTGTATTAEIAQAEIQGIAPNATLPDDFEHLVYECYCELGSGTNSSLIGDLSKLDHDETGAKPGYPLPYRVSIDVDSRLILEIRRDWRKGDEFHDRRSRYVKYGFMPQPDGGFYDLGLIHCVGNSTQIATMLGRSGTDAALYSNFPAFVQLQGPGSKQENTVMRPQPGEVTKIMAPGATDIRQVMMKYPFEPPSAQSMALLQKAEGDVKRLAGVIEIPIGEGRVGNTPVGTIMSYIESIAQVPGAIHKDDHISQQEEFDMLRQLFAEEPEALVRGNRTPARVQYTEAELMDPDIVPAADPNTPSQVHRLMKVQARVTAAGMPQFAGIADQRAVWGDAMKVIGEEWPGQFTMPPQPQQQAQPDPKIIVAQTMLEGERIKATSAAANDQRDHEARMAELRMQAELRHQENDSADVRSAMLLQRQRTSDGVRAGIAAADRAQADQHHRDKMGAGVVDRALKFSSGLTGNDNT